MPVKSKYRLFFFSVSAFIFCHLSVFAQRPQPQPKPVLTRIEFLFDASQSMFSKWQSGTKMDVAKKLMTELTDSLKDVPNLQMALRVFGHLKKFPPQDCDDTDEDRGQ